MSRVVDAEVTEPAGAPAGRPIGPRDWEGHGLTGPVRVMNRRDAAAVGRLFKEQYARSGDRSTRNRHVDLTVLAGLCENPRIWQPAHEILGDNLLLWRTNMFLGSPDLPWHEDRHAGLFLNGAFSLSMLLAIQDSPPGNCTVFAPGSHRLTIREKERRYGIEARPHPGGNVQYAGRVAAEVFESVPLGAGEMIAFHPELLHASSGYVNGHSQASNPRMSLALRVTTPDARLRDRAFAGPGDRPGDRMVVPRAIDRSPHRNAKIRGDATTAG